MTAFKTLEDARDYLEEVDVRENAFKGYDSIGGQLDLSVEKGIIVFKPSHHSPETETELKRLLLNYLKAVRIPAPLPNASLSTLVEQMVKYWYRE